jgi:sugar phosphate isomerase/epimerase
MAHLSSPVSRRRFVQFLAFTAGASIAGNVRTAGAAANAGIKLGFDNFAIRDFGWKAPQLLDYAASLKLDTLFISDLDAYESLEDQHLREIKVKADKLGVAIYTGSWSICPTSTRFRNTWGTAEEHLLTGIHVSKTLGSPVFRVVLGAMEDRKTPGGIKARIADTVKVLKACEQQAKDAGVKIAVENHAGDMHSWELQELVEAAGKDFVGVNIDAGNATWTLEDPVDVLKRLGPYTLCSSLRDSMIWESPDGAIIQWTAMGEGVVDWKTYVALWRELCPTVPFQIETISGFAKAFPYKQDSFWENYEKRADALGNFDALAKKGRALEPFKAPPGVDRKVAQREYQKAELERSLTYCRETLGLGIRR